MRTFRLNKLVRDGIVPQMQTAGQQVLSKKLSDEEFIIALSKKMVEEAREFNPKKPDAAKELADVLEVIEALAGELGFSFEELRQKQAEIKTLRGGFSDKLFIEKVSMADTDKWAEYYAAEPKRFPEE